MKRRLAAACLLGLLLAGVRGVRAEQLTLADAQVVDLAERGWVLRLRSSGPQAFDRTSGADADTVVVLLHGARLGALTPLGELPFGTVRVRERRGGVEVQIGLAPGVRVRVGQGGSPSEVEVRIAR